LTALRDQLGTHWRRALSSYAEVVSDSPTAPVNRTTDSVGEEKPMTKTAVTVRRHVVVDATIDYIGKTVVPPVGGVP
jgi:hypothetical protein